MGSRILVVAAVPHELRVFEQRKSTQVDCLLTGMGPQRAFDAVSQALADGAYRWVIATGFSGATQPYLNCGDAVAAQEVLDVQTQETFVPKGMMPSTSRGRFVTVPDVQAGPEAKRQLGQQYQSAMVDMETAAVARAAEQAQVDWLSVRVVLDPMEEVLAVTSLGQGIFWALQPWKWKPLNAFRRQVNACSQVLANELDEVIESVSKTQG